MSHSPITDFSAASLRKYKNRWSALSRLLHSDRSFSGDERHSAFLNLSGSGFADISAVSGFHYPEDGRALLLDDWDFDGDLDVWVSARTAPRLRLLQNDAKEAGQSLFIRLHGNGTTTNAEAIGARCKIWLKGDPKPLSRSHRAGDSFLSQASAWLHFGLGARPEIERVVVDWPAGQPEEFSGLKPGAYFQLTQGKGTANRWLPPASRASRKPSLLKLPFESEQARIVLPNPLLLPLLQNKEGIIVSPTQSKGATLVNLWSQACPSCETELKEWTTSAPQFTEAGLEILALNVDAVSAIHTETETQKFLADHAVPFLSHTSNAKTLQRLDLFQRSFLDRWLPLPVPCSFLLDHHGRAAVIYKGPVTASQLLNDIELLGENSQTLRKAATPFSGRWAEEAPLIGPTNYVKQLLDHEEIEDLETYYQRYLDLEFQLPNPATTPMIEAQKTLASIALSRKEFHAAIDYLTEALALAPQAPELLTLLQKAQRQAQAQKNLEDQIAAVKKNPQIGAAHLALGDAYRDLGNHQEAVTSYKNALRNDPQLLVAAGKLAWILATHPNPKIRNPTSALGLANRLASLQTTPNPNFLDLQGIALAANGDFPAAIKKAQSALELLPTDSAYEKAVLYRFNLYRQEKAYYESGSAK